MIIRIIIIKKIDTRINEMITIRRRNRLRRKRQTMLPVSNKLIKCILFKFTIFRIEKFMIHSHKITYI